MSFKDFIARYNDGSIADDASWHAYDIEGMATTRDAWCGVRCIPKSAKRNSKDNAYTDAAIRYGLANAQVAKHLLGLWYVWSQIATGYRTRNLVPREPQGA